MQIIANYKDGHKISERLSVDNIDNMVTLLKHFLFLRATYDANMDLRDIIGEIAVTIDGKKISSKDSELEKIEITL